MFSRAKMVRARVACHIKINNKASDLWFPLNKKVNLFFCLAFVYLVSRSKCHARSDTYLLGGPYL